MSTEINRNSWQPPPVVPKPQTISRMRSFSSLFGGNRRPGPSTSEDWRHKAEKLEHDIKNIRSNIDEERVENLNIVAGLLDRLEQASRKEEELLKRVGELESWKVDSALDLHTQERKYAAMNELRRGKIEEFGELVG